MSLRFRLLAALGAVLAIVVIGGVFVVRSQRSLLITQVDEQLEAVVPFTRTPVRIIDPESLPTARPAPEAPISRLFAAIVVDGTLTPVLQGQLLDDIPEIPTDPAELDALSGTPLTVEGVDGDVRFRLRVDRVADTDSHLAVALPLDEVDSALRRLEIVLGVVAGLVAVAIAAALWWVERLGIAPIAKVTSVAESISGGDRSRRVHGLDPRTEAGKLGHAFNLMLDDRDEIERRRRQFVADASHELRTPLTSIQGYLDLYEQGRFEERSEVDDMTRRMGREATRMKDLVEDLLLLANLDQQRPLRADRVDLAQLVADAAADARAVQPSRTVTVEVPDTPVETTGDRFRLQQVLGILVDNALTHTDPDAALRVAAGRSGAVVTIVVADEGPGLPSELAERVFDRFVRGDESRSRRTGNSGLGLAIARSIVEAHGGTIDLVTAPGAGCRFTITLPPVAPHKELTDNRDVP